MFSINAVKKKESFSSLSIRNLDKYQINKHPHYKIISQKTCKRASSYSAYQLIKRVPINPLAMSISNLSVYYPRPISYPFTLIKRHAKGVVFMPKRNRLPTVPDYVDAGRNPENLLVQKSNPLQSLSETSMTLPEFKILDAYLSRIDSHDEEKRYVRFEKGELEQLLGVTRILKPDLEKRLRNLFQVLEIHDNTKQKGFKLISLFSTAECEQDENGLWQVDLACTPEAMEYIFNIDNIGYLRYRLKNVIDLTSRYSYILYLYLENNRFRKSWDVDLDELKKLLCCTAETYSQYYRLNDLILKRCHKELTEKTPLRFTYEPIKKGRKVIAIRFTLETLSDEFDSCLATANLPIPGQMSFDDQSEDEDEKWEKFYGSERLATLAEGCRYEFNKAQMEQIFSVLLRIHIPKDYLTNDLTFGRKAYLHEKYTALNTEVAKKVRKGEKPIRDRFKYFLRMLENDSFQPVAYTEE